MRLRSAAPAIALALALGCATGGGRPFPPPPRGLGEEAAREVLRRFAAAVSSGGWAEAHALLSARWRAAYTPARLAADHAGSGPVGREAAERVIALLAGGAPLRPMGGSLALPCGEGCRALLVAEDGSWRVDALE